MEMPLISVILCTYNGATFLDEQLKSIVNQTYTNLEILISDDSSTDNTLNIITKYLSDPRIKLITHKKNKGYIKNFEYAINQTTGNFIAFSDQDDIWVLNKIETLYNNIDEYLLIYSDSELVDEKGESLHKKLSDISKMYTGNDTRGFVLWNVVWGHTMMIKKELLATSLPIPEKAPHDIWLAFKACTMGGIKYVDKVLTYYRQHSKTVTTTTYKKEAIKKSRTLQKRHNEFLEKLYWIELLRDNERIEYQEFYNSLSHLYTKKSEGFFVWKLFFFMLRTRKNFFLFRKKKWLSQIIEIRKQARGEKQF